MVQNTAQPIQRKEHYLSLCQFGVIDTQRLTLAEEIDPEWALAKEATGRRLYSCLCSCHQGGHSQKTVLFACSVCVGRARLRDEDKPLSFMPERKPDPINLRLYTARQLRLRIDSGQDSFPICGHTMLGPQKDHRQSVACLKCQGKGRTRRWLTEEQAILEERREIRCHKLTCSRLVLRLAEGGLLTREERKKYLPLCGAQTRKGTLCRCQCVPGKGRCPLHGGLSTGLKTEEGRARIIEGRQRVNAQRQREKEQNMEQIGAEASNTL